MTALWTAEWQMALRKRRVMVFSAGVPLLFVGALALGRAPAPHAALVYTVLFAFFGTFGAAVPWARDAERGWLHRLALTGVGMSTIAVQRVVASALIDLLELLPSLALLVIVYRVGAGETLQLIVSVAGALFFANALGILVAQFARSLAETALLASLTALLLLHAAGVFRTPEPGTTGDTVQRAIPFHYMNQAIRDAVGAP